MNRSKRRIGDDGRMKDEEDEFLNRLYGVDHAESVRPSDAEPPKPPANCEECGSPDVRRVHKLPSYVLFLLLVFGLGIALDQALAAFLLAASTAFAQQPQPQPKPDVAEGQQTPASKTTPGTPQPATAAPAANQPAVRPPSLDTHPLRWRSIGPANMGGRIADFAVAEKDPYTIYVAVGTGGVLKTTNNGSTWQG